MRPDRRVCLPAAQLHGRARLRLVHAAAPRSHACRTSRAGLHAPATCSARLDVLPKQGSQDSRGSCIRTTCWTCSSFVSRGSTTARWSFRASVAQLQRKRLVNAARNKIVSQSILPVAQAFVPVRLPHSVAGGFSVVKSHHERAVHGKTRTPENLAGRTGTKACATGR